MKRSPAAWSPQWWAECVVEPVQRRCAGHSPTYVSHRFPIKGGLPRRVLLNGWAYALHKQIAQPSFFARMMAGQPARTDVHTLPPGVRIVRVEGL